MQKIFITLLTLMLTVLFSGCTQQRAPIPEGGQVSGGQVSLDPGGVSGGVSSNGQYTGSDGVSRSGFKTYLPA